jgi:hypothetical protein
MPQEKIKVTTREMNEGLNKSLTRLSDTGLKNVVDTARKDNDFLERVPTALAPAIHSSIKKIPYVGSSISNAVRGIEDKLTKPVQEQYDKNRATINQAFNEELARIRSNKAGHQNARTLRDLMGMKEDPNAFGITALEGSKPKKGKR